MRERAAFAPTCNIVGLVSGYTGEGTKTVLPASRSTSASSPIQDPRDILAKLLTHLAAEGYSDIQVTAFAAAEPVVTPIDHPFVQRIAKIAESHASKRPSVMPSTGERCPCWERYATMAASPACAHPATQRSGQTAHMPPTSTFASQTCKEPYSSIVTCSKRWRIDHAGIGEGGAWRMFLAQVQESMAPCIPRLQ